MTQAAVPPSRSTPLGQNCHGQKKKKSLHLYTQGASVLSSSATLWTVAWQASLSQEFSRQESWSGLPDPSQFSLVASRVQLFVTPWTAACQTSLPINNCWNLLKLMSVMTPKHLLCCPLLLLPSIFPSIRAFSNESLLWIRWPKYWSFSFSISLSNEYSGLISFRTDWLDLLAVQGTLKSLLQHHSSKASILQRSAFCMVQHSHPYMTTGKTIRSDQISCSVVSDSLRPHESQHAGPPCPSPTPGVHSDSCPSSQ